MDIMYSLSGFAVGVLVGISADGHRCQDGRWATMSWHVIVPQGLPIHICYCTLPHAAPAYRHAPAVPAEPPALPGQAMAASS